MHLSILALLLLGSGDAAKVVNPSSVLAQPKFWAAKVGEVHRGQQVTVLQTTRGWYEVQLAGKVAGYVPHTAFDTSKDDLRSMHFSGAAPAASETQTANASRGFSSAANAADVSKAKLSEADAALASYQTGAKAAKLDAALAKQMPSFVSAGKLGGGAP